MKITTKSVLLALAAVLSAASLGSAQTSNALPSVDEVVANMLQLDSQRQTQLSGYTSTRRYVAVNKQRKAEMVVAVTCANDGAKQFTIQSEEGSHAIRKHVFYKMLKEEAEVSRHGTREGTRITPANYQFQLTGKDMIDGRPAYALLVTPKRDDRYLINGKIWVDAVDYSIVRIEGRPARTPSFWIRSVQFVHTYQKVGPFWFAASTRTVSQVLFFGESELTIENSGYVLSSPANREAKAQYQARVTQ